jgi:transposase
MAIKQYPVTLTVSERTDLQQLIGAGVAAARTLTRARILLKADQSPAGPAWVDNAIAEALEVSQPTVARVRKRFVQEGLDAALHARPPRRAYRRKLDGAQEAQLLTLACSEPPAGRARWTLRLLAERLVELEIVDAISHQTVRRILKKTSSDRT